MESGVYASMKIGTAYLAGAGLDGSVGPRVEVDVYAALSVTLVVIKAQLALQATFTLFDYTLNIEGTISPYGANVNVFTSFKPFSITLKLVLRYKTWSFWNGWSNWKTKKTWTLWSWTLVEVNHSLLSWHQNWWVPQKFPVLEAQAKKKPVTKSKSMKKIKMKKMSKRWKKYAM
jgi:hypothetical protein